MADSTPSTTDINSQSLADRLAEYANVMAPPKPVASPAGVQAQTGLWRTIQFVLRTKDAEFIALYSQRLAFVLEHRKKLFHELYVFRFFDELKLPRVERKAFERMVHLMITTCDPRTRQFSLKQVNLPGILDAMPDHLAAQRLQGFYSGL